MTVVVGQCCLCLFGNGFVYRGTLGIVEWVWETYHLHLLCLLPHSLLPPCPQAPWQDNRLQDTFSFHSHLSSNLNLLAHPSWFALNIPITSVRTQIRLCVTHDSWRPRLYIGLLRVDSVTSHWSVSCWPQSIHCPTSLPTHHYASSLTTSMHSSSFTISRRQARLCVIHPSWRPRLCVGLLRVDFASSHWSIDCWPQLIYYLASPSVTTLFKTLPNNNYAKTSLPESSLIHFSAVWFVCPVFPSYSIIPLQILSLPLMVKLSVTIGGGLSWCQIRTASSFHLGAITAPSLGRSIIWGRWPYPMAASLHLQIPSPHCHSMQTNKPP